MKIVREKNLIFNCKDVNESLSYLDALKSKLNTVLDKKYPPQNYKIIDFYGGKESIRVWIKKYDNSYHRHLIKWENIND